MLDTDKACQPSTSMYGNASLHYVTACAPALQCVLQMIAAHASISKR